MEFELNTILNDVNTSIIDSPGFSVEQAFELSDKVCGIPEMRADLRGMIFCYSELGASAKDAFLAAIHFLIETLQGK